MRVSGLIEAIKSQYQAKGRRVVIFAQGAPGIGKSAACVQAAKDLTEEFGEPVRYMQLQATIEDPITLSGLPARDDGHAVFLQFKDKLPINGRGILEIAEINTAPPLVQAGLYRLFLEGKLGSYSLPDGWFVVATGNRDEDRAATQRIPMPLIGRWCRIRVESDLETWIDWALKNGIRPELIGFYKFRPVLFNTFDPLKPEPYSCERTAEFASALMASAPPALEHEMLSGVLGEGVATELMAFCRIYRNLVSPDEILRDPDSAEVPGDPATACAVATALAERMTPENAERALAYIARMPAEYGVLTVKLALRRDKRICSARAYLKWAADHAKMLA
jgi:hypothetical protein